MSSPFNIFLFKSKIQKISHDGLSFHHAETSPPFFFNTESINPEKRSRNSSAGAARVMQNVCRDVSTGVIPKRAGDTAGRVNFRKLLFGSRSGPHNERRSRSATVTNRKLSRSVSFLSFAPRARRKPCKLSFRTELTVAFFNPLRSSYRLPSPAYSS